MALEADEAGSLFLLAAGATALTGRGLSSNYKDLPHSQAKRCHPQLESAVVLPDRASRFVLMLRVDFSQREGLARRQTVMWSCETTDPDERRARATHSLVGNRCSH